MDGVHVVEFTDPGCSWAWGSEPKLRLLRWRFPELTWRRVMGGLVGDMNNYTPGFDPVRAARSRSEYWRGVFEHTRMSYPVSLRWMYSSTEPAGMAVKAAEMQSVALGEAVLRRLREATFVFGRPADTSERILDATAGVDGLDHDRFVEDLASEETEEAFREDWREARRPNAYVMELEGDRPGIGTAKHTEGHWRYAFPTLVVTGPDGEATAAGWCPYADYEEAMETVSEGSTAKRRPNPTPEQVFARWPTATAHELEVLCGLGAEPPDGVVAHDWGQGLFYLTEGEAMARGIGR